MMLFSPSDLAAKPQAASRVFPKSPGRLLTLPAFTLVEMLVVIAIMTLLLTFGALGLRNLSKSSGVSAGIPAAEALFAEARGRVMSTGGTVRVLIDGDQTDDERYLRYMLVVYRPTDADGNEDNSKWIAVGNGTYLPDGVYFSRDFSKLEHNATDGGGAVIPDAEHSIYASEASSAPMERLSGKYYYYQFNTEGVSANPGASFIIGAGNKAPGAEKPRTSDGGGAKNFGGFVIWSKGTTSAFQHPDQMNIPEGYKSGDEF